MSWRYKVWNVTFTSWSEGQVASNSFILTLCLDIVVIVAVAAAVLFCTNRRYGAVSSVAKQNFRKRLKAA